MDARAESSENGSSFPKRRIALLLSYDGTAFNGWQVQNGGRTVQRELETAVGILVKEHVRVIASGRTDSGVHALGQVVHFDLTGDISLQKLCIGLNGILPKDVAVSNAYETDENFHARFSAVEREYRYVIYNHPQRSPFMLYRSLWLNFYIDEGYMREALKCLEGERDFASFCKKKSRLENTVRNISRTSVIRSGNYIYVTVCGNAFLHNMIRIIVGTCIDIYKRGKKPAYIEEILKAKNRDKSGITAPPYGLYLKKVRFSPILETYPAAFDTGIFDGNIFDSESTFL